MGWVGIKWELDVGGGGGNDMVGVRMGLGLDRRGLGQYGCWAVLCSAMLYVPTAGDVNHPKIPPLEAGAGVGVGAGGNGARASTRARL